MTFGCNVGYKQTEKDFTVALTVNDSKLDCIPDFLYYFIVGGLDCSISVIKQSIFVM